MLCYVMLCCVMLCCVVLCCAVVCCAVLCYVMLCYVIYLITIYLERFFQQDFMDFKNFNRIMYSRFITSIHAPRSSPQYIIENRNYFLNSLMPRQCMSSRYNLGQKCCNTPPHPPPPHPNQC